MGFIDDTLANVIRGCSQNGQKIKGVECCYNNFAIVGLIITSSTNGDLQHTHLVKREYLCPKVSPAKHLFPIGAEETIMAFLATFPEVSAVFGNLYIRQDLVEQSVTIYFKDLAHWHPATQQIFIAPNLIHFVEPDGEIVGIKVLQ